MPYIIRRLSLQGDQFIFIFAPTSYLEYFDPLVTSAALPVSYPHQLNLV